VLRQETAWLYGILVVFRHAALLVKAGLAKKPLRMKKAARDTFDQHCIKSLLVADIFSQ
jgi:hypothetical protein